MIKDVRNALLATAAMIVAASAPAHALLYNASYTLAGGGVVAMTFDGTLQGDFDTIIVNSLAGTPTFNGVAPTLGAVSGFLSFTDQNLLNAAPGDPVVVPATVSISGGMMDFIYHSDFPNDGFLFDTSGFYGAPAYGGGGSFNAILEVFNPQNWFVAPAAVPVPAALPLLAAGIGALGFAGYRRRA